MRRDRDAEFTAFVAAASGRLVRTAELLTGDRGRAEDLVQTALERAYTRWNRIQNDDPMAYVRRSIVNGHTDWWRRRTWRESPSDDIPDTRDVHDTAGDHARRDQLMRALAGLTRRERAVIVLRYFEDLTEVDIANALAIAPGTVKSTAARALGKLRISPDLHEERAFSGHMLQEVAG